MGIPHFLLPFIDNFLCNIHLRKVSILCKIISKLEYSLILIRSMEIPYINTLYKF
jgi:hypothetical protein